MPDQIDHVVLAVEDLTAATRSFTDLGFTVIEGGEHSFRKSRNVLVTFQDGSYLEIIAFLEDGPKDDPWWQLLQKGEGWVDYCLHAASIDPLLDRGIEGAKGPVDGGRITPDGDRIEWRTIRFPTDGNVKLPFVIEDVTPRSLRIPDGDAAIHPNGVIGIRGVTSLVNGLDEARKRVSALIQTPDASNTEGRATFALGTHYLAFSDPDHADERAVALLETRGPLPFEVEFVVDAGAELPSPSRNVVHGAQLAFVHK